MRNLSEIAMNHFEHHLKPRRWSPFPYFGSKADRTHLLCCRRAKHIPDKWYVNRMISWSHTVAVIYKTNAQLVRPQSSPKKGQNIDIYRKKDKRIEFWINLLRKHVMVHNSCHTGSIFLLWLGREVITLWSGGGDSLISIWMELITNANCNQKGISPPNWEIITWLCW